MPRIRKPKGRAKGEGYVYQDERGYWYARLTVADASGKRRNIKRVAESKVAAQDLLRRLVRQLDDHGTKSFDAVRMTFAELADYYETNYMTEPQYVEGRKVAGLRSRKSLLSQMKVLRAHFSTKRLRTITYGDVAKYKAERLATPTIHGTQRGLVPVHRELALLRRMFTIAVREGWILKSPFASGDPLINLADEHKRERILTREEEGRLIAVCTGPRAHLRPIIICAIDTGMRKGEIFKLVWSDIDFENRIVNVRAFNTKTMRERQVAMTARLERELLALYEAAPPDPEGLVFGILDTVKNGFGTARKLAGLEGVRFHDLRHTHATRLVGAHIPLSEVGRILGHTQANTTYRYVNANVETARRAAAVLDEFNREDLVDHGSVVH